MKALKLAVETKEGKGALIMMCIGIILSMVVVRVFTGTLALIFCFVGGITSMIGGQELCKLIATFQQEEVNNKNE